LRAAATRGIFRGLAQSIISERARRKDDHAGSGPQQGHQMRPHRLVRSRLDNDPGTQLEQGLGADDKRQSVLGRQRRAARRAAAPADAHDLDAGKIPAPKVCEYETGDGAGAQ
jgi:hypothetical protein